MPQPRVALVTGGNRGIGFEICRQLAARGLTVVLTARDEEKGRRAADELSGSGTGSVLFRRLDVTDAEAPARVVAEVEVELGGVDVLVNNAGVLLDRGYGAADISMGVASETFAVNFFGAWRLCQAVVPGMRERGYGRIVNVSSGMGQMTGMGGGYPAYRLSKLALNGLTRILAAELGGSNVLVNSMSPGWVQTEMGGANAPTSAAEGADTAVWLATLADRGPTGGFFERRRPVEW
ncbi:MAG: SDR family oxidoreductase [Thermoanaerobaculia bacterium]